MEDEQSLTPMLEMSSRVAQLDPSSEDSEPATPSSSKKITKGMGELVDEESGLASEFAVGLGIPSSWDEDEGAETDDECCSENQMTRLFRACTRGACKLIGARRLGHMAVLASRELTVSNKAKPADDEDKRGEEPTHLKQTELLCVVGPFWPFAFTVTYPLVICISATVAFVLLPNRSIITVALWAVCVLALLVALSCTACRNPGVLRRHSQQPNPNWRWNDQARTFRPPGAVYDDDLGLIVEQFDHVCPWTVRHSFYKNRLKFAES